MISWRREIKALFLIYCTLPLFGSMAVVESQQSRIWAAGYCVSKQIYQTGKGPAVVFSKHQFHAGENLQYV